MKTIGLIGLIGLIALGAPGQSTTVMFPLRDLTGSDQVRLLTLQYLDPPTVFQGVTYYGGKLFVQTVPGGATNFLGQAVTGVMTNLVGGNWRITYGGLTKSTQIYVPWGFTNFLSAADPTWIREGVQQVFNYNYYFTNSAPSGALLWNDDALGTSGFLLFDP